MDNNTVNNFKTGFIKKARQRGLSPIEADKIWKVAAINPEAMENLLKGLRRGTAATGGILGSAAGGLGGAATGLIAPGTHQDAAGNEVSNSRLESMLTRGLGGAAAGGAIGAGAGAGYAHLKLRPRMKDLANKSEFAHNAINSLNSKDHNMEDGLNMLRLLHAKNQFGARSPQYGEVIQEPGIKKLTDLIRGTNDKAAYGQALNIPNQGSSLVPQAIGEIKAKIQTLKRLNGQAAPDPTKAISMPQKEQGMTSVYNLPKKK